MSPRAPGDPIPKELVRDLRLKHNLSQDEFAQRLGVRGGKSVVSAWEGGRAPCEGPVAELVLALFAGKNAGANVAQLLQEAERIWRRAPTHRDSWRQLTAVPEDAIEIERAKFVKLFPEAALPHEQHAHGFPTVELHANVYGLTADGWVGSVPFERERAPHWIWALKRTGEVYYREVPWEETPGAVTIGQIQVWSLLALTLKTVFLLRRVAKICKFPDALPYTLQLDMEGVADRGLVAFRRIPMTPKSRGFYPVDEPRRSSPENHVRASVRTSIGAMNSNPLGVGYDLVGEMALLLRPDLASADVLADQLRRAHAQDREHQYRFLGFLDSILK